MRVLLTFAIACALGVGTLAACGGARGTTPPARTGRQVTAAPDARPTRDEPPSATECAALVAHAIDVVEHERTDGTKLTDADRSNMQALADARCRTMARASFACALAAQTSNALAACDAPQSEAGTPSR